MFMNDISNGSVRGRYQYFVDNIQVTDRIPSIRFWLALPMTRLGQQISVSSIKPPPQEIIEDCINGNVIIFWEITPSSNSLTFQYDFEVIATDIEFDIDTHNIKPYDNESELYR